MIQKGDDLINGVNHNYQYPAVNNSSIQMGNTAEYSGNSGNLIQTMSFEDYVPLESTLPPVETVLPQYIPTPPPSLPSPSVNISTVNTTVPQFQFQLQHQTTPLPSLQLQHNQNINNHQHYYCEQLQHQQVAFHSSSSSSPFLQFNHNKNIESTMNSQLFDVDGNYNNHTPQGADRTTNNTSTNEQSSYYYDSNKEPKDADKTTLDTSPNTSMNHSIQSQETILNVSESSTVDAEETDNLQPFTYLDNLNSDNLMKFSQQSVLQQLIQEQLDVKPNLNLIPTCEEHDHGGYNFRIQINCSEKYAQRPGVVYSKESERLYLKTNENVYIDCFYTQKMPIQPLKVRVFAVFEKDASAPVLRCQNHISTDNDKNEIVRKSLVRCKNPDAVYYGSDTGKSINDRYSVVVPLNSTVKGNETNQLKQQLIISFTCFNSCMNRKQTAVIFLLEGMNGEILAQRTLSVKISTCPKRDRRLFESSDVNSGKRKQLEESNFGATDAKMPRFDNTLIKDEYSRSSYDEASDDGIVSTFNGSVQHDKETGDFILTLRYKSRDQLLQAISAMYGDTITTELRNGCHNGKRTRDADYLRKLYHTAYNIKTRSKAASISTE